MKRIASIVSLILLALLIGGSIAVVQQYLEINYHKPFGAYIESGRDRR